MEVNKTLIKGSLLLLIMFNIYNFLNFMFQFTMARLLTIAEFGIVSTLFSMIYIFSGFSESIQIMITKYSANQDNRGKLKNLLKRALKKSFFVSAAIFGGFLVAAIFISRITKINYLLVSLTGVLLFAAFLPPVTRGILQGKKRFKSLGLNVISEAICKLILSIIFVLIGWKVYGAILGTIISVGISFGLSFIGLRDILKTKEEITETKTIYQYSVPSFFIVLTILLFYSLDVFIARIFFPAEVAGSYAIASVLSKIIFFGTGPISKAMIPMSAEKNLNEKKSKGVFINAFALVCLAAVAILVCFYFFPETIVKIFSGRDIIESSQILFFLGLATTILSFANLILLYKLSVGKTNGYKYLIFFVILEIFLLSYFSNNLFQFSIAFVTASAVFLWGSIFLLNHKE